MVGGLEDVVRRVEDDEGGTGYVGLMSRMEVSNDGRRGMKKVVSYEDLSVFPKAGGESLELRLRPSG